MSKFRITGGLMFTAALLVIPTPSVAAIDPLGTNPVLDALCDDALNANDNSGFTTYAIEGSSSTSSVTVDDGPAVLSGVGTPVQTFTYTSARVNGPGINQSVNIHAVGDRVTTYPSALATIPTKTTVTTTVNGTCHVHKPTSGADNDELHEGYNIAPPGLQAQIAPVSSSSDQVTYGSRTEAVAGPWIDPNSSVYGGQFVICNSPGKNPGTWRGQNGYVSQLGRTCSTAWYLELNGNSPSVSVPAS